MNRLIHRFALLLLLAVGGVAPLHARAIDPLGLVLSWQRDPTTTMTIDWHTADAGDGAQVQFRPADGEHEWRSVGGSQQAFPFSDRTINRVELTGLQPDTDYLFRVGDFTRERRFRTMPSQIVTRPVRIALGGDVRGTEPAARVSRFAMQHDPDFVIWGGDLAYANGDEGNVSRWYELLDQTMHLLVTPDGRSVPVVMGIGNHEVRGGYITNNDHDLRKALPAYTQTDASRAQVAPFYYALVSWPGQPGWGALDFGDYLSLLLLDTDHSNPVDGEQTRWLQQALQQRIGRVAHVLPIYHVGAYPSVRDWEGRVHQRVRQHWSPLFDQFRVPMVFENHDHTYKRTWPIRGGKVDPRGTVYMGDGAWGTGPRVIGRSHEAHAWYLDRVASQYHSIILTLQGNYQSLLVVNDEGTVIDEYPRSGMRDLRSGPAVRWVPGTKEPAHGTEQP
ncbi:MAG: metallophosphoesterase family protein [Pseudoxanthomonas suwonensis]|nr:metallophosphoesterase family protein [Pseudoxanthomonas suwonensis]